METYAYPLIGDVSVQAIDTALVMKVIEPIWATKPETANRVRGRIESILDWATVRGFRHGENPALFHSAHGFIAKAFCMVDGRHARTRGVQRARLARGMNRDAFAGAVGGDLRLDPALIPAVLDDGMFDCLDGDGGIDQVQRAGRRTWGGADAAGEVRKIVAGSIFQPPL